MCAVYSFALLQMDSTNCHMGYPVVQPGVVAPFNNRKWRGKGLRNFQRYKKTYDKGERGRNGQGYDPPRLKDLQKQNRLKTRRYYPKRRMSVPRTVPRAPFNNSSFLMQVRRSGGLLASSYMSSSPTSFFMSPACSSYNLGANEPILDYEDYGYGSMTGLIHLRPTEDDHDHDRSSGSTVVDNGIDDDKMMCNNVEQSLVSAADSLQQLEQRIDRDVSRFEMAYPVPQREHKVHFEERVTRQDGHIAQLEDENLTLKERLFLMQLEVDDLKQRLEGRESCVADENTESTSSDQCSDLR